MSDSLTFYQPLWAARFDDEAAGLLGGSTIACIPFNDEWHMLQKSSLALKGAPPQLCLTTIRGIHEDQPIDGAIAEHRDSLLREGRCAVLALRLYQAGWFLSPELAERSLVFARKGWNIERLPGVFRQTFLPGELHLPLPAYSLSIHDLCTRAGDTTPLNLLMERLLRMELRGDPVLALAGDSFNRSYGLISQQDERLAHLFIALEALLGGFNEKGRMKLDVEGPGAPIQGRIRASRLVAGDSAQLAYQWASWILDLRKPGGGLRLRNDVAHGHPLLLPHEDLDSAVLKLQLLVRTLLCQYLAYLDGETTPDPVIDFNRLLARVVADDIDEAQRKEIFMRLQ
jgi:hypothetical protein